MDVRFLVWLIEPEQVECDARDVSTDVVIVYTHAPINPCSPIPDVIESSLVPSSRSFSFVGPK